MAVATSNLSRILFADNEVSIPELKYGGNAVVGIKFAFKVTTVFPVFRHVVQLQPRAMMNSS